MKGLAFILGKGASKGDALMPDDEDEEMAPDSESSSSGSARGYARLVVEAIADKDTDGAVEALMSLVRSMK